ncbi:NADP-dependent oxidoreductase [Catenuloplanes japonicus]|uniref:NADP-dependent oxidoreductase n=1 Tax=Catenuloplanes japonicus TaxID=33876 RepID=UPI000526C8DF|nr:NADP-dependent oxidoreductase [Catenuloplanes japonicus]
MRALHVPAAGEKPQIGVVPVPAVASGEVLIRVRAAALNPIDGAIAAGVLAGMLPHSYPVVLGRDAAGIVEAAGPGVTHVVPGDEVFGHIPLTPPIQAGTLAEYVVLPAATVVVKPAGLTFTQAAALPLAAAAASQAVDAIGARAGQTVLVNGASGGVGSFAVQLLAARGATVIATGADVARLTALGATLVVDRAAGPVADQVLAAHPSGVDALINLFGRTDEDVPLAALRPSAPIATLAQAPAPGAGRPIHKIMATPLREITAPLALQAAAGTLTVDVVTVIPLDQATDALTTITTGHARGKTVVTFP